VSVSAGHGSTVDDACSSRLSATAAGTSSSAAMATGMLVPNASILLLSMVGVAWL
jgi:hypothetical protein